MEYALGGLVVLAAVAVVLLPIIWPGREFGQTGPPDPSSAESLAAQREAIYREIVELQLDRQLGKLEESDFEAARDGCLARAASLLEEADRRRREIAAEIEQEVERARHTRGETTDARNVSATHG